jgi:predicted O-linked N-acetylglucosamine transferase (SPINDLY family)
MRILKAVPNSVLWLIEDNPTAATNLRLEASNRGIVPDRIIFASRIPIAEHLARHRQANLFLDTLPYNAHTTASDALWAGLPVLTCKGTTFPGRVAASLLQALNLNELIVDDESQYEAMAISLALNPSELQALKRKLDLNAGSAQLFDTTLFTRQLENNYLVMMKHSYVDN